MIEKREGPMRKKKDKEKTRRMLARLRKPVMTLKMLTMMTMMITVMVMTMITLMLMMCNENARFRTPLHTR